MLKSILSKLPIVRHFLDANRNLELLLNECAASKRIQQELTVELLKANPRCNDPKSLIGHEAQLFSQNGEDGVIAEIFRRIGTTNQIFVEIGLGNGLESNTALLLQQGWQGWWIEANQAGCKEASHLFRGATEANRLKILQSFVTAEKIDALFKENQIPEEFDLLSLDVDRNTYYIWEALASFRPRVAVIEYNGLVPPSANYKVPYAPEAAWDGSGQFGAGLKSYELLGAQLGYRLVGCELTGANAFFVRADLVEDHFMEPFTAERHFQPLRLHLLRNPHCPRKFEWEAVPNRKTSSKGLHSETQ